MCPGVCARALLVAEQMILDGRVPLDALADQVLAGNTDTAPVSGRQEYIENIVNRFDFIPRQPA